MSLVGELGRERFLHDALEPVVDDYDEVVIDTPPNLGLLTVNALVSSGCVLAPVSAEDEGAVHGILELRGTITKLAKRLGGETPRLIALVTRWSPTRISSRKVEDRLAETGLRRPDESGCGPRWSPKRPPHGCRSRAWHRTAA
jgi:chromosome partitioning protein